MREHVFTHDALATLRAHEPELRKAGVISLSIFGSLARGEPARKADLRHAIERDAARAF